MSPRLHHVRVRPLPRWLDRARWLGPEAFTLTALSPTHDEASAHMPARAAADLCARLRGLGLDGSAIALQIDPPLPRNLVRASRLTEARALRETSPGFTRPGARLDAEARYSLTPEALAFELGQRARGLHVLDVCCGGGGNSIGFARAGCTVTAIELDPARARDARHNLGLYGVLGRTQLHVGDARALLPQLAGDLAFVDPPWGRDYDKRATSLRDLPLLDELLPLCRRFARTWIKVPPSFATADICDARASAMFGVGEGDLRRVKFVVLELPARGSQS